ncbi:MAG: PTS sugar transporter subunit IIC, partial [Treponema sp.]|nr:PTS sugar transporter subunit IIC [Treponema sp.]
LQMPNIIKNPKVWIPVILTSAITGPLSTCLFKLQMNGAAVSSGMGTCGLVGQIGMVTGWYSPVESAVAQGATAIVPGAMEWIGLVLISFVLPAVLTWAFGKLFRKIGWIKDGDLTLQN